MEMIERLKVCGTCKHWEQDYYGSCRVEGKGGAVAGLDVDWDGQLAQHGCTLTPPRWTPYWEEPARKESL
jgi:hypothetical protein